MGQIFAIGGGEIGYDGAPIETTEIDEEIIRASGKKKPRLLFIPTASGDAESYCTQIEHHFGERLGCSVKHLRLTRRPSSEVIERLIKAADIVYVGGGDTRKMMIIWRRFGVDKLPIKAYEEGTVLSGLSAGAICWFEAGSSDTFKAKDPSQPYVIVDGLGLIEKAMATPHFDTEQGRPESQKQLLKDKQLLGLGIDECAALEINDNSYRILSSKKSSKVTKSFWKNGKYCSQILKNGEYTSIDNLYDVGV